MIVTCSRCEARFRVADEKIGPRGAKVRCSRCQNVFVVRVADSVAPAPLPAAAPTPPAGPRPLGADPFADAAGPTTPFPPSVPAPSDPFVSATDRQPDPFAAPAPDPFRSPAAPSDDPFVLPPDPFAAPAASAAAADPFDARTATDDPFAPSSTAARASDPFAAPDLADPFGALSDPFAATVSPRRNGPELGDLSLGERTPSPGQRVAASSHVARPEQPGFDLPSPDAAEPPEASGSLSLEERVAPAPSRVGAAGEADLTPAPLAGLDTSGAPFDPSEVAFHGPSGPDDAPLALAGEATPGPASAASAAPRDAPTRPRPRAAAPVESPPAPEPEPDRVPGGGRPSRLHAITVNAVALAAILVLALGFLVAWRGDRGETPEATGLLASAAALLGRGHGATGPLAVARVGSGRYDRATGPAVFFVRGVVTSRAAAPLRAVRVEVEVVRDGQVLARGAAPVGAVPTPEELHLATDGHALDALASALRARAPSEVLPGASLPFLVPLPDAPDELGGASLRVVAAAGSAP